MKNTLLAYIDRFRHDRRERAMLGSVLLVLAIIVTLVVYWQLRLSGVAMTNATYCGYEEHVHTEECYETTLVCNLEEIEGHTHDESCYDEEGNLVCELEETEGHTHSDECYEQTPICGFEEHTHTVECLVDLTADVEDATIWEETLPELTGDLRTDVVNIAYSQLGYTESVANYTLGEDGVTHLGYTRYGAWYGNAYSDWDSMFVAFCLEYADITEEFTFNAGAYAWSVDLANLGYYQLGDSYSPTAGDILFLDVDSDGKADNTAVVVAVDESLQTVTVIQGNYSVTDGDGNITDTVALVTYTSPVILGYANLTPEEAVGEVTEEIAEEVIEELTEEIAEEVTESDGEEMTASAEEVVETEEGETEANETADEPATVDYVSQVTALYTQALSLAEGDTKAAATVWDELMAIWEQIYAEEEAGTLALTTEEYDNVNTLTDEVYDYFVNTVGYDPYEVMTLEEENNSLTASAAPTTDAELKDITTDIKWSYSEVSYDDGEFSIKYRVDFEGITYDALEGTKYIKLDIGEMGLKDGTGELGLTKIGKDGIIDAFNYTFYQDETTGEYYIVIEFLDSYIEYLKENKGTASGYIEFTSYWVGVDEDGNAYYQTEGEEPVVIPTSEITHDKNETWNYDLTVDKYSSGYNPTDNTITYTVYVSSESGTTDIALTDLLSGYTGLSINSITVDSVEYQINYDQWGNYSTNTSYPYSYSYTTDTSSTATSNLTITLSPLAGADSSIPSYGDRYVIKYTVTFDPSVSVINTTINNDITGTSYDDKLNVDIIDTASTSTKASNDIVSKTGSYSSGTVTWTIDFNQFNANIYGYSLTDTTFASASSFTVTLSDGTTAVQGGDYELLYDSDNKVAGILFLDTGGNNEGTNTNHYIIEYTEEMPLSVGTAVSETNVVNVYDDENNYVTKDSAYISTPASDTGGISKSYDYMYSYDTEGVDYIDMVWTTSLTVKKGMLSAGTTVYDNLGTNSDSSVRTVSETGHWFSAQYIVNLASSLMSAGYSTDSEGTLTTTGGLVFVDGNTTYIVGSKVIYVITTDDGVVTDVTTYDFDTIYGTSGPIYSYFAVEACIPSDTTWGTGTWVDYSTITSKWDTYKDIQFTAYRIVFNVDLDGTDSDAPNISGTASYTYKTIALADVTTSQTYYNHVGVGSLTYEASHTEYNKVYKTDGSGKQGESETKVYDDGTLTWKVKVYVENGATDTFKITDTLPSDISFVSADIATAYHSGTISIDDDTDGDGVVTATLYTANGVSGGSVTGTFTTDDISGEKILIIVIDSTAYSDLASQSEGGYITITYTCKIDDFSSAGMTSGATVGEYTNEVDVYYGNAPYGDDTQKQTVTYGGDKPEEEVVYVTKSGEQGDYENTVYYNVLINPEGRTLSDENYLTVTDTLKVYAEHEDNTVTYGTVASLSTGSVHFYKIYELTWLGGNSYMYYDDNGDAQYYTLTASSIEDAGDVYTYYTYNYNGEVYGTTYYCLEEIDVVWTYTSAVETYTPTLTNHVITATVPDSTPILMSYAYDFVNVYTTRSDLVSNPNTVTVTGNNSYSDDGRLSYDYNSSYSSAGISTDSIMFYKTDSSNTSKALAGAVFNLYEWAYDSSTGEYGWVYSANYTTDSSGEFVISKKDSNIKTNTAYYLVEYASPDGYLLDSSTKYYFYASDSTSSTTSYPTGWLTDTEYSGLIDISSVSEIVYVTNSAASTTSVSAEKVWKNSDGTDYTPTDGDEITLELRYYLGDEVSTGGGSGGSGGTGSNSATLYFGNRYQNSSFTSYSVPYGVEVTVAIDSLPSDVYGYGVYAFTGEYGNLDSSWRTDLRYIHDIDWATFSDFRVTFETDADHPIYTVWWDRSYFDGEKITISYTSSGVDYTITSTDGGTTWDVTTTGGTGGGGGTGTGGSNSYEASELTGESGTHCTYAKYTITYNVDGTYTISDGTYTLSGNTWTLNLTDLPATSGVDGTNRYRMYYFVETSSTVPGGIVTSTTYSIADGTNDGSITITNVVTINNSVLLPSTGGAGTKLLYEFGVMLILLAATAALAYRNLSRLRKSLVSDPAQEKVPCGKHRKRLPDMKNRKFVNPRIVRKGDSRAGPDG